jgi:alkanesulfonate monooxygenase SsuD/methylene tetrahydromethanopterin reductase-like flavin-dependent oxidoreductase (luciferase family)
VQLPVAQAYLRELAAGRAARVGLSRAVYPAEDRRTAVAHLGDGVAAFAETMVKRGLFPSGLSQEEYFVRTHIHFGHPEQVVASLRADVVMAHATELICQVHPGHPTPAQMVRSMERIAREVAPELGWRPAEASP